MEKNNTEEQKQKVHKPSYFYVLLCKDRSLYAGYTTDLKRREKEHNTGTAAKYTRPRTRRPLKMIYAEKFQTKSEAMQAEYAFKQLRRVQKEKYLSEKYMRLLGHTWSNFLSKFQIFQFDYILTLIDGDKKKNLKFSLFLYKNFINFSVFF